MGDCTTCPRERRVKVDRPYRSVPRHMRYTNGSPNVTDTMQYYYTKQRYSPAGCESSYPNPCSPCQPVCPCPSPCADTQCCYCPGETDSGLLHTIRNGFQRIFNGSRKRGCATLCKGKVYNYSTSQLKYMEQHLDKLEDEAYCIESAIKDAFDCDYRMNCNDLRCSLTNIMDRGEGIRNDLLCAYDCYDPYRDRCEYELICTLLDRVNCLEGLVNDLCLQLECLEYQFNCCPRPCEVNCRKPCCIKRPACKPNCRKPCCYKPMPCKMPYNDCYYQKPYCRTPCEIDCRKPCCAKPMPCEVGCRKPCCVKQMGCDRPRRWRNGCPTKPLCRTSSVIPVGVMLVKL